jgi:hypothetical protein
MILSPDERRLTASGLTTFRAGSATRNSVIVIFSGTANLDGGLDGSNGRLGKSSRSQLQKIQ